MDTKLSFRDFLWVLMAYLRGKVLRQKAYRPQGNIFPAMSGSSIKRMLALMDWWGYRPMTLNEAMSLRRVENQKTNPSYVPYGDWTDKGLSVNWVGRTWSDNSPYRFLGIRRSH